MAPRGDLVDMRHEQMDCPTARELVSAAIDDELEATTIGHLEGHLEQCATCRTWQDQAHALRRMSAMTPASTQVDLTGVILARAGVPDLGRGEWVRALVGAISLTLLLVNIPMLITGSAAGADPHVGRHLGAFGAALAIGLGYAALRPERALGMLPLAGALGATLVVTAVIDTATGTSTVLSEVRHLVELAGLVMLWIISGGRRRLADRLATARRPAPTAGLRAIE